MLLIRWNSTLSVGVKMFDDQHNKLIDMINALSDAMSTGKGKRVVEDIIEDLSAYTKTHFAAEEHYFDRYGYLGAQRHKAEHRAFEAKIEEFRKSFATGQTALSVDVISFLYRWLQDHIKKADKQYAAFFNENGLT